MLKKIFIDTLTNEKSYPKKPGFKIKPSSLGSPCMRKIYYDSANVEPDFPFAIEAKRRMKLGDSISSMLHEVFSKAGIIVDYHNPDGSHQLMFDKVNLEFPLVVPELFISKAFIDAVLIIDGKLWLGEYKSINLRGFTELMNPKSDHMYQGVTYFYAFNKLLSEGAFSHIEKLKGFTKAEGIIFLYINKDDTEMKEFVVTEADEFFGSIVNKILQVKQAYDSKTLPGKTKDWCQSCNWRTKCSKNFNDIVHPSEVKKQ